MRTIETGISSTLFISCGLFFAACTPPPAQVKSDQEEAAPGRIQHAAVAPEGAQAQPAGPSAPGQFDFYVLSLSWSPQHCATRGQRLPPNDPQCGGSAAYGFIVHGLWPQFVHGYPESCAAAPELDGALVQRILRIMPSDRLIHHEWEKHGTCSGLSAPDYFGHLESLWNGIKMPPRYAAPKDAFTTTLSGLRQELTASNPSLPQDGSSISVICQNGSLQELRMCFTKDFAPQRCTEELRDSCPDSFNVRPLAH